MIDSNCLEMVGTSLDPSAVLGTVGYRRPAEYVIVNGRVTVRGGRLTSIDERTVAEEAKKKCRSYLGR